MREVGVTVEDVNSRGLWRPLNRKSCFGNVDISLTKSYALFLTTLNLWN